VPARRSPVDYVEDQNGCWIWQLARNSTGYGLKWDRKAKRLALAHRLYYEREHGPIPAGHQVDHLCRVRACVNPSHLEAVPASVNTRRMLDSLGIRRAGQPPTRDLSAPRAVNKAECIEWQRCRDRDGYGAKWADGRRVFAHRWAFEQANGPLDDGMTIDHLCGNRACVNPTHMEAVSSRENKRRSAIKATCKRGHPWSVENTLWERDGRRRCKACRAAGIARRDERAREQRRGLQATPGGGTSEPE
jgi:hypothetical protein